MIKKNIKILILATIITFLPTVFGLCVWDQLPAEIPIHYNWEGMPNQMGNKLIVMLIPLITLPIIWAAALEIDIREKNAKKKTFVPNETINLMATTCAATSVAIGTVTYMGAFGKLVSVQKIIPIFLSVLLVFMGNKMPKTEQNNWIGVRTKATLSDKTIWVKTQRLIGKIMTFGGLILIPCAFLNMNHYMMCFFGYMVAIVFVSIWYPIYLSKHTEHLSEANTDM